MWFNWEQKCLGSLGAAEKRLVDWGEKLSGLFVPGGGLYIANVSFFFGQVQYGRPAVAGRVRESNGAKKNGNGNCGHDPPLGRHDWKEPEGPLVVCGIDNPASSAGHTRQRAPCQAGSGQDTAYTPSAQEFRAGSSCIFVGGGVRPTTNLESAHLSELVETAFRSRTLPLAMSG